ncbi:MAG: hypothetical protein IPK70_15690 [Flavobacteriales bacterium]|nr:hypothetical protein [Flavobacteriales bacterium]
MNIALGISTLLLIAGCSSVRKPSPCATASYPTKDLKSERGRPAFSQADPIGIRFITSKATYPSSLTDTTMCHNWLLTAPQLQELIYKLDPSRGGLAPLVRTSTLSIIGEIDQNGAPYCFAANGGSWVSISSSDTTLYFGDLQGRFRERFIRTAWNPEQEK